MLYYEHIIFTQGLRVVLELHQHSAAEKLTREIQQVGVVEQHDEFLEFSGHDDCQIGIFYISTIYLGTSGDGKIKILVGGVIIIFVYRYRKINYFKFYIIIVVA